MGSDLTSIWGTKAEVRARRVERARLRRIRHKERSRLTRACFWTRPFGHEYVLVGGESKHLQCVACPKTFVPAPGGGPR